MPLELSDQELNDFLDNRLLLKKIIVAVGTANAAINSGINLALNPKEKLVYDDVIKDITSINNMLAGVQSEATTNITTANHSSYEIKWRQYDFAHVATITKRNPYFFWTIYAQNAADNKVELTHMNTNGTLADVQKAFDEVSHLLSIKPTLNPKPKGLGCNIS